LYENWASTSGNPYAVSWNDIVSGSFDKVDGYYAYRADLGVACTPISDSEGSIDVKIVQDDGSIKTMKVSPASSATQKTYSSFVSSNGKMTCADIAAKVSETAPLYRQALVERKGQSCYEAFKDGVVADAQKKLTSSDASAEEKANAQSTVDQYNELVKEDSTHQNFVTGADNYSSPLTCVTINGSTVEEESSSEADPENINYYDEDDAVCYEGAGALGWILCPITATMRNATSKIYENIVEPYLRINVSAFDTDNGVYQGWQFFQNIANIIFVILFLVTIISQITGFGIDNYGVKRLLPKLIIAAILVNLSYWICMILVDVSNIVGAGAEQMFSGIRINGGFVATSGQTAVSAFVGGAALTAGGVVAWNFFLIPFLLGLVGVFISIVFMFVLLSVRQAGVIILVVVAPVAFVMYMLPNTKPIFDKWKKLFQSLLFLYPLCGLLIGGGAFAGRILQSTANGDNAFWISMIGALLAVVPFFFIPTLLRGSMSAAGNIGARITGLGQNLGRGAQQRIGNSQAVQDAQRRRAAGVDRSGNLTTRGKMMNKIARGESRFSRVPGMQRIASRSMARGLTEYVRDREAQLRENELTAPGYLESKLAEQDSKFAQEQVATEQAAIESSPEYMTGQYDEVAQEMVDLMMSDRSGENATRIKAYQNALNKIGDDGRSAMGTALDNVDFSNMSTAARQAWANNLLSNHAADFKNNARSQYEAAKRNVGVTATGKFSDFVSGGAMGVDIDSYRPEQFAEMDDGEFSRIMANFNDLSSRAAKGQTLSTAENERLEGMKALAYAARNDTRLRGSLKGTRRKDLEAMSAGYTPLRNNNRSANANANPNQTFNVQGGANNGGQNNNQTP
ncbi:hypothetical protein IKW75_01075, partial [Candidatus Saccharibacteria bacterium]|nr:hypothetical protein [Candidatus Saccharibacteria bacterium]